MKTYKTLLFIALAFVAACNNPSEKSDNDATSAGVCALARSCSPDIPQSK